MPPTLPATLPPSILTQLRTTLLKNSADWNDDTTLAYDMQNQRLSVREKLVFRDKHSVQVDADNKTVRRAQLLTVHLATPCRELEPFGNTIPL